MFGSTLGPLFVLVVYGVFIAIAYFVIKFAVKNGVKEALRERDEEKTDRS